MSSYLHYWQKYKNKFIKFKIENKEKLMLLTWLVKK